MKDEDFSLLTCNIPFFPAHLPSLIFQHGYITLFWWKQYSVLQLSKYFLQLSQVVYSNYIIS